MSTDPEVLKKIVLNYWKSPNSIGSFGGLLALQTGLKLEKNIDISIKNLRIIMQSNPFYLQHIQNKLRFDRRKYSDVYGYMSILAADIAYMNPVPKGDTEKYMYILACQDIFSRRIFAEALTDKSAKSVRSALESVFSKANATPRCLEVDRGTEFRGNITWLKSLNINVKFKGGNNKSSFAEHTG
jgi:hypothetical protein